MKKILSVLILISMLCTYAAKSFADESADAFEMAIPADAIPFSDPTSGSSGHLGLSGRAVTGIALGSTAGLFALGGLAWLYKSYAQNNLFPYSLIGYDHPVTALNLDKTSADKLIEKNEDNYYLKKALEMNEIHPSPTSKYILVPDTYVKNTTYNGVCFTLPKEIITAQKITNVKVTQISDSFKGNDFEGKIFLNRANSEISAIYKNSKKISKPDEKNNEIKLTSVISKEKEGVVQKLGRINFTNTSGQDDAVLVISYNKTAANPATIPELRYAYVIEFSSLDESALR